MSRKTEKILAAITAVLSIVLCFCLIIKGGAEAFGDSMDGREWAEAVHVVCAGETLWDMAQIYCPEDVDCRDWIERVTALNGIDGYIYPGEELVVLITK